jgi:hypothetical protein
MRGEQGDAARFTGPKSPRESFFSDQNAIGHENFDREILLHGQNKKNGKSQSKIINGYRQSVVVSSAGLA